ncbi:MAG TPA: alpha/beta fold hydrolase [Candidatus Saccharimonadales bacterium]|nr:alpha/beta fold hydrolase [Candidatus Saccharimonadales bacterium]
MRKVKIKKPSVKAAAALIICLLGAGFLISSAFTLNLQTGQLGSGTYSGETLAHSLDLSLASKATYPSSPLKIVKNLGVSGDIKEQVVSFAVTTDHLTEYALMMLPAKTAPPQGFPAIILCHGYINPAQYKTTEGYISDMQFYADHGFAVIKPDFRGQGMSAKQGIPASAYYSMAYNIDVMSLINSLKQTGGINKSRLNLWGHSMGAYIALRASVISKDIKNTILLSVPGGSLKDIYLSYVPPSDENNIDALKTRAEVFDEYGTPAKSTAFWRNASPVNFLWNSTSAYQIHLGLKDSIVPTSLATNLNSALAAAGKTHQYYKYPNGEHGLQPQRYLIWSRSLQLLEKSP